MKLRYLLYTFIALSVCYLSACKEGYDTHVINLDGERWWGGTVRSAMSLTTGEDSGVYDLSKSNYGTMSSPLLLSSQGRYIWSEQPFEYQIKNGDIYIHSKYGKIEPLIGGTNLKEAYLTASSIHFPPSGDLPDTLFFSMPQYNTWIELTYNQNQGDIILYANNVMANDFPIGVFMIDDNWQKYYGNFEFKPERFPDPKGMIDYLHQHGFKIMLWICPFVSPDSAEFRELRAKGYLIKEKGTDQPAIIRWWNGYSACYDLSNPRPWHIW